jgi:hypothetical protein
VVSAHRTASEGIQGVLGAPVVAPLRFSLLDSFLVAGISPAGDSTVDLLSLFLYLRVRGDSISTVCAVVPGRDGGL